jgi:hypothetical protein
LELCEFKVKTLAKIFSIAILGLTFGLNSDQLSFNLTDSIPHETNPYRFIPRGASCEKVMINTGRVGLKNGWWYNRNYKTAEDYQARLEELGWNVPSKEVFLDLDGDDIPDLSAQDLDKLWERRAMHTLNGEPVSR